VLVHRPFLYSMDGAIIRVIRERTGGQKFGVGSGGRRGSGHVGLQQKRKARSLEFRSIGRLGGGRDTRHLVEKIEWEGL